MIKSYSLAGNGLRLGVVADFYDKCSYEERMFVQPRNCHREH